MVRGGYIMGRGAWDQSTMRRLPYSATNWIVLQETETEEEEERGDSLLLC